MSVSKASIEVHVTAWWYGRCTPDVRPLSVGGRALARDTGDMAGDAGPTAFVTGATGFTSTELVEVLVARGYQVFRRARSVPQRRTTAGVT